MARYSVIAQPSSIVMVVSTPRGRQRFRACCVRAYGRFGSSLANRRFEAPFHPVCLGARISLSYIHIFGSLSKKEFPAYAKGRI